MKQIEIFTDGSCLGNGSKFAKGGIGVFCHTCEEFCFSKGANETICLKTTNQTMEICAIYEALYKVFNSVISVDRVVIYSDSDYSIKCFTNWINGWSKKGWKTANGQPVKNQHELKSTWDVIDRLKAKGIFVSFVHLRSHQNPPQQENRDEYMRWLGNHKADEYAVSAAHKSTPVVKKTPKHTSTFKFSESSNHENQPIKSLHEIMSMPRGKTIFIT